MSKSSGPVVEDLKSLTSLRFVAAMMIVVYHAPNYFPWLWAKAAPAALVHGVSFFFVLSGFILTHVYRSKPFPGYTGFLRARYARLWPIHIATLLILVAFVRPDSITFDGAGIFSKWIVLAFNVLLLQAAVPFIAYAFSWNAVAWSISTEVFFYLAFPFLLIKIERSWHWKLLAAATCAVSVFLLMMALGAPLKSGSVEELSIDSATYANPLVRGFEFVLGMASWVIWDRCVRRTSLTHATWTVIELVVILAIVAWIWRIFPAVLSSIHSAELGLYAQRVGSFWLFAILIVVMASGQGRVGRLLNAWPLVFLGEISFSIYMLHQVLMKVCITWLPRESVHTIPFFCALLFLSAATYLLIEKPSRLLLTRQRRRASTSPLNADTYSTRSGQ